MITLFESCDFKSANEHYNIALDLAEKKQYSAAINNLNKAIEKKNKFRPALINRAAYKERINDFEGAITDLNYLLEFDTDNTMALYNLGFNYHKLENYKNAIKYYSLALRTEGALKTFKGQNEKSFAINTVSDYIRFDSDADYVIHDCKIYFYRGIAYSEINEYNKAINDFENSIKSSCSKAESYYFIGEIYLNKKDSIRACKNFISSAKLGDLDAREMLKEHCLEKIND